MYISVCVITYINRCFTAQHQHTNRKNAVGGKNNMGKDKMEIIIMRREIIQNCFVIIYSMEKKKKK